MPKANGKTLKWETLTLADLLRGNVCLDTPVY